MTDGKEYKGDHFAKIFDKLNEDRKNKKKYCDVKIKSNATEFSAHKPIIGLFCEFMEKLFMSQMKERYSSSADMKGINSSTLEEIMNFIYTEKITLTRENALAIYTAADYMQIMDLLAFCEDYLIEKLNVDNCLSTLLYAQQHKIRSLTEKTLDFISKNVVKVLGNKQFLTLSINNIVLLLERHNKYPEIPTRWTNTKIAHNSREQIVYSSITKWIKHDERKRRKFFDQVFRMIDLSKLPETFLKTEVKTESLVRNSPVCMDLLATYLFDKLDELRKKNNFPRGAEDR